MRSVRTRADVVGVDYSHFSGQRRWTAEQLRSAVEGAHEWTDVAVALGLEGTNAAISLRGHAARLGIDAEHLSGSSHASTRLQPTPSTANLSRAGTLLAASWFALCGGDVSWPLEPCRYDLIVAMEGALRRVQVKTTTVRVGTSWKAYLSTSRGERRTYAPDEVDDFFIVDGDLNYYLIPVSSVGGLHAIHLDAYRQFRLLGQDCRAQVAPSG